MASMAEMVEAHLMNVQREIANLRERKSVLEGEIEKLQNYLQEGQTTLLQERASAAKAAPVAQNNVSVFNP